MSLSGRHYSFAERLSFLRQAGWPDVLVTDPDGDQNPLLVIMTAISEPESSGYACAHNPNGENSWGLWQVNLDAWPQYTPEQLCDPLTNARIALSIYRQQGLDAWGPWITGIYSRAMPQAWQAYQQGGGQAVPVNTNNSVIVSAAPAQTNTIDAYIYYGAIGIVGLLAIVLIGGRE